MTKQGPRRGVKRQPTRPKIDDDLAELASVLAENKLEYDYKGWFSMPWRCGWNAVRFAAVSAGMPLSKGWFEALLEEENPTKSAALYWTAQDLLDDMPRHRTIARAALRCLQIYVGNSDGGGTIYNEILRTAFEVFERDGYPLAGALLLEWRCRDAIGTTCKLQNDANDRSRRAFKIAWERGLYHAAYAIREVY